MAVFAIFSFPPSETSQAHPLPNWVMPASTNSFRNASYPPNAASIFPKSAPSGLPGLLVFGLRLFQ